MHLRLVRISVCCMKFELVGNGGDWLRASSRVIYNAKAERSEAVRQGNEPHSDQERRPQVSHLYIYIFCINIILEFMKCPILLTYFFFLLLLFPQVFQCLLEHRRRPIGKLHEEEKLFLISKKIIFLIGQKLPYILFLVRLRLLP